MRWLVRAHRVSSRRVAALVVWVAPEESEPVALGKLLVSHAWWHEKQIAHRWMQDRTAGPSELHVRAALNAQQGIIVTGAIFQRGWDRQSRVPKAPTKVGRERMTHHDVSVSPIMYAAD